MKKKAITGAILLLLGLLACRAITDDGVDNGPVQRVTATAQAEQVQEEPTIEPTATSSPWATESDYAAIYGQCRDIVTEPFWEYPETPLECQKVTATWGWVAYATIGDKMYNVYREDGSGFPDIERGVEVTLILSPWAIEDSIFFGTEWDTGEQPPTKGLEVIGIAIDRTNQ